MAGKDTALTDANRNPKTGRFVKGNTARPPTAVGKKKPDIREALASIDRHFPDSDIGTRMAEVYDLALAVRSPKAALAVLELALAYRHGKPIARQMTLSATPEWLKLFAPEEEGEIVEVDVEEMDA